jgi:hypothetical protein
MTTLTSYRFPAALLSTKPGPKGRTLTFVDVRHIAGVLDALAPGWTNTITLSHNGTEYAAICDLTVEGIIRADVGSGETPPDASNQAFRRAAAAHGLGRYLWVGETEPIKLLSAPAVTPTAPWQSWQTPSDMYAWAISVGAATDEQHAHNALAKIVRDDFAGELRKSTWPAAAEAFYLDRLQRKAGKATA